MARRSFWAWGTETDEPDAVNLSEEAQRLSARFGARVTPRTPPTEAALDLRPSRIQPPADLAEICSADVRDRAFHTYGRSYPDRVRAFNADFPNPPDLIARPRDESEVERVLAWCAQSGVAVIPFGGGSSVVGGVEPPEHSNGVVTLDLERLSRVLEVDDISRAARIQAGVYGPDLERQLRPHGLTMRHYPQSFQYSTLGGWIVTRSGGHYATNHTHIDDFVESTRMLTPRGVWESRRLPGSGAGPSPDRLVLGSEGILGVVTEAWVRLQARPRHRASAGLLFPTFEQGWEAARAIAQAKLWPANLRILDPAEAKSAGLDGKTTVLAVGFESSEVPQKAPMDEALRLAQEAGGRVDEGGVLISDGPGGEAGRQGAVGRWRDWFIRMPFEMNATIPLGLIHDTFETSTTWDRWPAFDGAIRDAVQTALDRVCGGGIVTCRFSHVYPDGPAPYYGFVAMGRRGEEIAMWQELKTAASDAVIANGGTITHHHAVGRMHRPWYDRQRPDLFAESLRAVKRVLDPNGILNPGVLIDP